DADSHPNSLQWLSSLSLPKVPVDVAATGPAVIALGARLAERVTFNVGADAVRLAGAIAHARRVREKAGLPAEGLSLGAYLGVARLIMVGPSRDGPPEVVAESKRLLRDVVLPGLRSEVATRVPARRG